MIPGMIEQGYRAIAVAFDVWGFANLVHGGLQAGRAFAQQAGETNGTAEVNGKAEVNGTASGKVPSPKVESDVVVTSTN
jgi:4-hydroxy-2-oxoheptanedioate aldolase